MKNQKIYLLSYFLNGVGFISLLLFLGGFEARANSINDSENNSFGSKKIKWIKADGFGKIKDISIKTVTKQKEENDKAFIVKAEEEAERKEKSIIKKIT